MNYSLICQYQDSIVRKQINTHKTNKISLPLATIFFSKLSLSMQKVLINVNLEFLIFIYYIHILTYYLYMTILFSKFIRLVLHVHLHTFYMFPQQP